MSQGDKLRKAKARMQKAAARRERLATAKATDCPNCGRAGEALAGVGPDGNVGWLDCRFCGVAWSPNDAQ